LGMGRLNPSCTCCESQCLEWSGTPPATIQLTLPATCERAGTHVLSSTLDFYTSDCPGSSLHGVDVVECENWELHIGSGAAQDTVVISVFEADGVTYIIAGVCNQGGTGAVDAGNVWGEVATISNWDDLDGYSLPWDLRAVDIQGMADCTGSPPGNAVISFVP
jgi:hypothetical protein